MYAKYMMGSALLALAITSVGCVRFDGLEEGLSVYGVGAAGTSADGGGTCTPNCPSTCRTSAVSDGCTGTCAANCSTSCSDSVCQSATTPDAEPVDAGPVDAGPVDAGPVDAGPVDAGCTPQTDTQLCGSSNCGAFTTTDNCGSARTVASCGTCTGVNSCGGGGVANVCGCSETDAAFCTRLGATCGTKSGTDNCGSARTVASCGSCANGQSCTSTNTCMATSTTLGTTASIAGDGLSNCGPSANESCAASLFVRGGTFYRWTDTQFPATLSDFRLDKYEVTVGRFRKFVDAWVGGWRPSAGAGRHTHLNGGAGLVSTAGGNEPGWDATWNSQLGTAKPNWDTNLTSGVACNGDETWTSAPGSNEKRPQNCLSWYDLYAFCIWDGGFLPSYAEWEYAAAGGSAERTYPWGSATPTSSLAVYGTTSTANVGGLSAGAGRWGQLDLAGNVSEWNLDWDQSRLVSTCDNCTDLRASSDRVLRGGAFLNVESFLSAASRQASRPWDRFAAFGGRCARTP